MTGDDGQYTIADVRSGSYTLTPSKAHYTFDPASLTVLVAGDTAGQDFVGTELLYYVSGTVALADGTPIAGVTVSNGAGLIAVTDTDGW